MGEHKIPKPTAKPPKRPSSAIVQVRMSVEGWKSQVMGSDPDTDDFMRALQAILAWVDELEAATDPFAKIVPSIHPSAEDSDGITSISIDALIALTVGDFRRLNPNAAEKPKLDS